MYKHKQTVIDASMPDQMLSYEREVRARAASVSFQSLEIVMMPPCTVSLSTDF